VDFLAKMAGDEESILHIEFQTRYDPNMPVQDACVPCKDSGPLQVAGVHGRGLSHTNRPPNRDHIQLACRRQAHIHIQIRCNQGLGTEIEDDLQNELCGLYALTPLMPDADLAECIEKMIEAVEHNLISASSYMGMATFARLKYSKEVVNDFFTKNRVKTVLRERIGDITS
jgi:hypothetical protein